MIIQGQLIQVDI